MIELFSSVVDGGSVERYATPDAIPIAEWLYANGIDRTRDLETLPLAIFVNGSSVTPAAWPTYMMCAVDEVDVYRVPKGTDPFSITFALVFGAKAALKALMPKLPTAPSMNNRSGKGLDEANAKGNKVKLNSIRTQCFGFNPARYPDFATPSRRYFVEGSPREQRIEMCMFVGEGYYQIPASRVRAGETALTSLGDDARFAIYQPGQNLSDDPAHLNWYPAPEVGPSSSGSPGLELTTSANITVSATASAFTFNDHSVTIASGAGSFPADWGANLLLRIFAPYPYIVADGTGDAGRDVITGDIAALGFPTGALIEIAGTNAGTYVVHAQTATTLQLDYLGGVPAAGLVIGNVTMSMAYPGMRYKITTRAAQALAVQRLLETGDTDLAWSGWPNRTTNAAQLRIDESNMQGGYRGAFPACPAGELVSAVEYSLLFTTLIGIGREGQEYQVSASHQFEYRDMALGGNWTTVIKSASNNSMDAVGYTFRINMPYPMRAECRIKRLPVTQDRPEEVKADCQWYSLFGLLTGQSPTSYEGMTVITCDIRGGDRLSTNAENLISLECTRILPVLRNGAWQDMQPTREISATIGQISRDVGYSDTQDINIVELERLESTRWTPRGEYYDKIVTAQDTVKGYMIEALVPGFSELTIDRGVMTFVRDEPRGETFDHIYNPRVMLKPMVRSFVGRDLPDQFDGVDVEYFNHITRQNETVECRLELSPGVYEPGVKVKKETLEGVGDKTRAWRYGMRVRRALLYRQGGFEFETELAGLNSSYMSYAGLGCSTPKRGQNSEVVAYSKAPDGVVTLRVSTTLDWSALGAYKVVVRRLDGTAAGPFTPTRIDDRAFTIPSLDFVPDFDSASQRPIIQFGPAARWIYPALITEVKPKGTKTCALKAVPYDVRVYADDNNFPPA